jgi:cytochrome P450
MISGLIGASYGDDVLSDEEICYTIIMTFVAGHETTRGLLGNGLLALLQNPDQFALLRAQPELVPNAVQEMLRYDCPLQMTQRLATRDVRICDTDITEGDTLLLCLGAANRDPDLNEDPHQFRVDRKEPTHIAFGYGIHNCLGGALATLEGEIVFRTLLERWKTVNLAPGDVQWVSESFILRGLQSLNIEVQS